MKFQSDGNASQKYKAIFTRINATSVTAIYQWDA